MKLYNTFLISILVLGSYSISCLDYYQNEYGCITSTGIACKWNSFSNKCSESTSQQLGCQSSLNKQACIQQTLYPDKVQAKCIFNGYCREVDIEIDTCLNNLSLYACLAVETNYCTFNEYCSSLSDSQAIQIASSTTVTNDMQLASVAVCQLISGFPAIHQEGIHDVLITLYLESLGTSSNDSYLSQLEIPGCFEPPDEIYSSITCDAAGLNSLACILVEVGSCIFKNGKCQEIDNFTTLKCSDSINKNACLSVENYSQTCYWTGSKCDYFTITSTTVCKTGQLVSPSVCANILSQECFFDSSSNKCNQMCRSTTNIQTESVCKQSSYGCVYSQVNGCQFSTNDQCNKTGQNLLSCNSVKQYCQFVNGFCYSISNLSLLSCSSGLNYNACINLSNPSQVCIFYDNVCSETYITPEDLCQYTYNVNQNACRKITTGGCYWINGNCAVATGSQSCTTDGLNKIGCLNTSNPQSPCQWNGASGQCESLTITREDECTNFKIVNSVACSLITYINEVTGTQQLCKYNSTTYSCETFTMDNTITCTTAGLNEIACSQITNTTKACRWSNNSCVEVTSLSAAITCASLQSVTQRTCAMIQSGTTKCKYDSNRMSCTTSVQPTSQCSDPGLNPSACASLNGSCYFNTTTNTCVQSTGSDFGSITCDTNYPTSSICVKITQTGQYCQWVSNNQLCAQYTFPTVDDCNKFTQVNKLLCLAYYVSISRYITSDNYCTYDSINQNCITYTSASNWADCGTTQTVNLHACVRYSNESSTCYFDLTTLQCTEITNPNDTRFSTLLCRQGNKSTCQSITTTSAFCVWSTSELKCYPVVSGFSCSTYSDSSINTNASVCASTSDDDACQYDTINLRCKTVDSSVTNLDCTDQGLNLKACLKNTQGACYFNSNKFKCVALTNAIAIQLPCASSVNKLGCLGSLNQPCKWTDTNECVEVTDIDFTTVTCQDLANVLYNSIVCARVSTYYEFCGYDDQSFNCVDLYYVPIVDCQNGFNYYSCTYNPDCSWDSTTYLCTSQTTTNTNYCKNATTPNDCLAISNDTCVWKGSTCNKMNVNAKMKCAQVAQPGQGQYNKQVCMSITATGEYCAYNSSTNLCVIIPDTQNNNDCALAGLNNNACIALTNGNYCIFESDISKTTFGCSTIDDISAQGCSIYLNRDACFSVTVNNCMFDKSQNQCSQMEIYTINEYSCTDFSDPTSFAVTNQFCKYVNDDDPCTYDSTNHICIISTALLAQCTTSSLINEAYCLSYISTETCYFDFNFGSCSVYDTTYSECQYCYSFRQCETSKLQSCLWSNSKCSIATIGVSCTTLQNVNALACMQNENGTEKCQFQDNGLSSQCIIPINDTQNCYGLNKIACIANTANPCYYDNQCHDISVTSFQAKCDGTFFFNQLGCVRLRTPSQLCKWENGECVSMTIDSTNDTCTQYASSIYSALVCASIETGSCYWNNGCVVGNAPTCSTYGANKNACIQATSGNCIFSSGVCFDVANTSVYVYNYCNEPSNMGGCLNLNNGLPCIWQNNTCDYAQTGLNCATYTNVNPGTCAQTTDVPCSWSSNNCIALSVKGQCTDKGLNRLACVLYTNGYCYYNTTMNQCETVTDITKMQCTDNLNENSCLSHTSLCCKWNGTSCITGSSGSNCSALSVYSQYCCISLSGDYCTYPICTKLLTQDAYCYEAINQSACMYIETSCRWDTKQNLCISAPLSYGCKSDINETACVNQASFCKYINNVCVDASSTDTCASLQSSSNSSTKCIQVTDVGCAVGINGCTVTPANSPCAQKQNIIACLDNLNTCQWNNSSSTCQLISSNASITTCPDTSISRGYCSQIKNYCYLTNYKCSSISTLTDSSITCDMRNVVPSTRSNLCTSLSDAICQYDSTNQKCTSTIFGSVCSVVITKLGCAYIQNNCYWDTSCKQYDTDTVIYLCESIFTKYQCLINIQTACTWDDTNHKCVTYSDSQKTCANLISTQTSPGICYYFSTDYCAYNGVTCYVEQAQSICTQSKSPLGCQANTSNNCYWNIYTGQCLELSDTSLAANMSCPLFKYSNKTFCLAPIQEGQTCHWSNNLCVSANIQEVICTSDLSLHGCTSVAKIGEQCIFDSICQYTDNTTTLCGDDLNIYGCMAVQLDGQYCQWLGQECQSVSEDGYEMADFILINANVCRKTYTKNGLPSITLEQIAVKYDTTNFVCTEADPDTDLCSTLGLNYFGCLLTIADTCDWNGSKCISFDFNVNYSSCEQYQSVSPKTCASITTGSLKCVHNSSTFSCETFKETQDIFINQINQKQGMNRLACLSVYHHPTIWEDGLCKYNAQSLLSCGQLIDVNPRSCAQVDYQDQICKYSSDGKCTTQFDSMIDKCSSSGLNKVGCVQVETSACQYSNGFCITYNLIDLIDTTQKCTDLKGVNALVCSAYTLQGCKFSFVNRGCVNSHSQDLCTSIGINKIGCQLISTCSWINNQCYCAGQVQLYNLQDCSLFAIAQCTQSQCIIDNNKCRNKVCSDYSINNCNHKIGKYQCYVNNGNCSSAAKCSDLFNVSSCKSYYIGSQCDTDTYNTNHCTNQSCINFTQDKCSGSCVWSYQCESKECQNQITQSTCNGIMNNKQCYWDGSYCQGLSTCQEYMNLQTNTTALESLCNSYQILGKQCNWQLVEPYGSTYQCSSSICSIYGSSISNCNGYEVDSEVCVLLENNYCVACSEISDQCTCMTLNYCVYSTTKGCTSNPCSNLSQVICEQNYERCVYSNDNCKLMCSKLLQEECQARELLEECHWNSDTSKCYIGSQPIISINTIADEITISDTYSQLLYVILIIWIL